MIRIVHHGDVTQFEVSSLRSRAAGFSVSMYLVRGVLVDVAFPRAREEVRQVLQEHRVRAALITHSHEDHAGNVELVASLGLPIWMAPATLGAVTLAPRIPFYRRWTWGSAPPLRSAFAEADPGALEAIHAPGHSADHHVVWDAETGTLFSSDLFLGVKVRVAHDDEDLGAMVLSLRAAAALQPRRVFDAHRGLLEQPIESLRAKADWTEEVTGRIEERVRAGDGDAAIVRAVMGGEAWLAFGSRGEYSRANFVRSVRRRLVGRKIPSADP